MITAIIIRLKKMYAKLFSAEKRARFRSAREHSRLLKIVLFPFNCIWEPVWWLYCYCNPYELSDYLYYEMFHRHINWENPRDLNEKMQWIKFYSDTSLWPQLTDKYTVREWVAGRGLGHILNELYAVFKNEKEIDCSLLPQSFVLKLNNGCHDRLIIKDKDTYELHDIRRHFRRCRRRIKYFVRSAEHFYLDIKPCVIIAEKLLVDTKSDTELLMDYKFYCFHGKPRYVMLIHGRNEAEQHIHKIQTFDMEWNYIEGVETDEYRDDAPVKYPRPESFAEMKQICETLASGFPFVRVDLYEINGRPVFGEMTFTPSSGRDDDYVQDFLDHMGDLIDLSNIKKVAKRNRY